MGRCRGVGEEEKVDGEHEERVFELNMRDIISPELEGTVFLL